MPSKPEEIAVSVQVEMLKELLRWRRYLPALAKAIREVLGEAEAYIFGSAVENKLTANSDIDVMIVVDEVPRSGKERARILSRLWEVMESSGAETFIRVIWGSLLLVRDRCQRVWRSC